MAALDIAALDAAVQTEIGMQCADDVRTNLARYTTIRSMFLQLYEA